MESVSTSLVTEGSLETTVQIFTISDHTCVELPSKGSSDTFFCVDKFDDDVSMTFSHCRMHSMKKLPASYRDTHLLFYRYGIAGHSTHTKFTHSETLRSAKIGITFELKVTSSLRITNPFILRAFQPACRVLFWFISRNLCRTLSALKNTDIKGPFKFWVAKYNEMTTS